MKFFLFILLCIGSVDAQLGGLPFGGGGGIPYPNQVTDIGVACKQYEGFANKICKPTPTEFSLFRPKCDQYRLYCKGLQAPSATAPALDGLLPPPPPDVCPQINYCTSQRAEYNRVCPRPPDQDSVNFCTRFQAYCANVPQDTDGLCASQTKQQQEFQQQQYQAMMAQQQSAASQTAFNQPFNGNPFPFSASQSMPGTYVGSGIIGRKRRFALFRALRM